MSEDNSTPIAGLALIGFFAAAVAGVGVANSPMANPNLKKVDTNQTFSSDRDRYFHEFASNDEINPESWTALGNRVMMNEQIEFLSTLDEGNYWIVEDGSDVGFNTDIHHVSVADGDVSITSAYSIDKQITVDEMLLDINMSGVADRGINLVIKETDSDSQAIGLSIVQASCTMRYVNDRQNEIVFCKGEFSEGVVLQPLP